MEKDNEGMLEEVMSLEEANEITAVEDEEYDESQIQVLEGLEAVRKRPGMYIGTTSAGGLHHLVYEIVDNSIDEAMAGHCDRIDVTLFPDGSVEVSDNGRGVPSQIHHKMNKPTLEVVFSVLHAGGKFGGKGYKIAGGLHGVGASVVNALSLWFKVDNCYEGQRYTIEFEKGNISKPFECVGSSNGRHGLTVRFKPDPDVFTDTTEFDIKTLLTRLREQAFLNAGIRIVITDKREKVKEDPLGAEPEEKVKEEIPEDYDGEEIDEDLAEGADDIGEKRDLDLGGDEGAEGKTTYVEDGYRVYDLMYRGGIKSFVEQLNSTKGKIHPNVIYMKAMKGDVIAEIAMQYNDSYNETIVTFANNMATIDGGTHETLKSKH